MKRRDALQNALRTDIVVFDKAGTLPVFMSASTIVVAANAQLLRLLKLR